METAPQASISCTPPDARASQLSVLAFAEADELQDHWRTQLQTFDPPLVRTSDACAADTPGTRKWGFGNIACRTDGEVATVSWTDNRNATYATVQGADDDIGQLYAWWRDTGRPMGRSGADASTGEDEPGTSGPSLDRQPGRPTAFTCAAQSGPIRDAGGRLWRIDRVRFMDRQGYERIVLQLSRVGRAGDGGGAQADIERVPISRLRGVLPNAPRPRRGRTALIVRLDGVRDAPDLRRYRPSGVDRVKELSILGRRGSRAVLLGVKGDACYQVRVPVWGSAATGKERTAEIFIDIRG